MKQYLTGFFMAWGNFCALPCPCKRWDTNATPLMLGFLPSVGVIIGAIWAVLYFAAVYFGLPYLVVAFLVTFLPFALCGFLHMDGFMHCSDAILSRRPLEDRQRILKDSHTGAFAVISPEAKHLIETAERAFWNGIAYAKEGYRLSDISHAVQQTVETEGFGVIRDFVGHGIGSEMHEDPQIPNVGKPGKGPRLQRGMTLAIEPMITQGSWEIDVLTDDWTAVTVDGGLAAHYENTVVITDGEPELLTL